MIMQQTVPFVALFAAMATLVSLNRRYELVIARVGRHLGLAVPAAGLPRRAALRRC